ncbi:MAG: FtsW/RodA/SpoVE family cell cycle protein [Phycisphaerae bacterium]|nr:FtsW/RodA/SpoVE family cell cycle protein [Phycisphaerae bacterium]MDD5380638.1 FtsW/RodA/SpoVE family cell cycle protein [Phycisphaerae bacterium]
MLTTTKTNSLHEYIAAVVVILMALGTVFVFSAGVNVGQDLDLRRFYDFPALRQILFFPIACVILYAVSFFNYRRLALTAGWLESPLPYLLVISIALLILVLFPQFGTEINQARRWLRIPAGPITISFQPSELAKWVLIFFIAAFCDKFSDSMQLYRQVFVPICLVIAVVAGLIIIEDFGTAVFVSLLSFLILIIAGVKWWHILTPIPFAVIAFIAALLRSPAKLQRIIAFLRPEGLADSAGYQANQSLIALGSGGLWGKGLGKGICKYGHLPEDTTDFIFAIIGEELGFIGTAVIILLFIIFIWLGILVVVRCRDRFGQLLAAGIVLAVGIQAALNIGVVTVVLPTKGIPLPFVSAGGTSMLLSAVAVGVLLNIAKQSAEEPAKVADAPKLGKQLWQRSEEE